MNTILAAAASAVVLALPALGQVTISDGTFSDPAWIIETVGTGSVSGAQVSGGLPGTARQVDNMLGAGSGALIRGLHRYGTTQATTYEPLSQGAITSLQFSLNYLPLSGPTGGQGVAIALKQGQTIYFSSPIAVGNGSTWMTYAGEVTAASFQRMDGQAGAPNFSSTGARIRFGFMTYNSASGAGTAFTTSAMYDNFSVTVVPGPASAGMLGALGLFASRRRRREV